MFGSDNDSLYVKDGINEFVVAGRRDAVNPEHVGTKAAALCRLNLAAGELGADTAALERVQLSRAHAHEPYVFRVGEAEYQVSYLPAESDTGMFGGNSNWRGPI